jgi:protein-tyrosine phosphatase
MVEVIPMEDHNPPLFLQIPEFCAKVESWLNQKAKNVAIVHCKAGKVNFIFFFKLKIILI